MFDPSNLHYVKNIKINLFFSFFKKQDVKILFNKESLKYNAYTVYNSQLKMEL